MISFQSFGARRAFGDRPIEAKIVGVPELIVDTPSQKIRPLFLNAFSPFLKQRPSPGPDAFGDFGRGLGKSLPGQLDPKTPNRFGKILAGHPQLIRDQLRQKNLVVIKFRLEAMSNRDRRIQQYRVPLQPGLKPEVEIFNSPASHSGILPSKLAVQGAANSKCTSNQCGRFIESLSLSPGWLETS